MADELKYMKTTLLVLLAALLAACASKPPPAIAKIPPQDLSLTQVRIDIDRYLGSEVRWGGIISKVENKTDRTWIEIVRHELGADGRPLTGGKSDGRFIASFGKFVDPLVYETGRSLTVVGAIEAKTSRPIGEFEYQFPIVAVEGSFLWKQRQSVPAAVYPPPYIYYNPWHYHSWSHYRHPRKKNRRLGAALDAYRRGRSRRYQMRLAASLVARPTRSFAPRELTIKTGRGRPAFGSFQASAF